MTRREALVAAAATVAAVYGNEAFAFERTARQAAQQRPPAREMDVPLDGISAVVFRRGGRVVRVSPDDMLDALPGGKMAKEQEG